MKIDLYTFSLLKKYTKNISLLYESISYFVLSNLSEHLKNFWYAFAFHAIAKRLKNVILILCPNVSDRIAEYNERIEFMRGNENDISNFFYMRRERLLLVRFRMSGI